MRPSYDALPGDHTDCRPVREIFSAISGKWTIMALNCLGDGPRRFSQLQRDIGSISQKVLTQTLRELEADGFITRTVTPVIPPRVDYELTDLGRDLLESVNQLGAWAVANRKRVEAARQAFAEASEQQ